MTKSLLGHKGSRARPAVPRSAGPRLPLSIPMEPPATRPLRVAAVINPIKAQATQARDELRDACEEADWPMPTFLETTVEEPGGLQARQAIADGAELILALGGDGTVREVAYGVAGSDAQFGVVALGTANLFARNLHILPSRLSTMVRMALHGMVAHVDLGLASFRDHPGEGAWSPDHPFLVMAGIGEDARTVVETREGLKSKLGWLAYLESGARHMLHHPIRMRVSRDGEAAEDIQAWTVLAGNCGRIPAGIEVFPDAVVDDGRLTVLEARIDNPLRWVGVAAQGLLKVRTPISGLHYHSVSDVVVTPETPLPVQLDGDAYLPVGEARFRVWPRSLTLRLPPGRTQE